ncbi:unnamed protein product, partial [marine sediment metagenome]
MQDMIRQGMVEGAVGLSTGLSYPPGIYASTEELVALCQTVAERLNKDSWDAMCDLMIEEDLGVSFWCHGGDMNDVKAIMTHPAHMFITDGLRIGDMPNPRTYGTYPKILGQLVRDEKILTMEQAIRKMTSFPAQRFGLASRGILRDGMKADIVVFNPVTVNSTATFAHPKQFPLGID